MSFPGHSWWGLCVHFIKMIYFSNEITHVEGLQSCPTLCDPMDCSPPDSSVHGILHVRTPMWAAISFSIIKYNGYILIQTTGFVNMEKLDFIFSVLYFFLCILLTLAANPIVFSKWWEWIRGRQASSPHTLRNKSHCLLLPLSHLIEEGTHGKGLHQLSKAKNDQSEQDYEVSIWNIYGLKERTQKR